MSNNARRAYIPTFTLHGAPYDPLGPTTAPIPRSAPAATARFPVNTPRSPVNTLRSPMNTLRANTPRSPVNTRAPPPFLHPDSGPSRNGNGRSARNSRVVAAEIAETVSIMRENIQSVTERGERLENLESRTGAHGFYAIYVDSEVLQESLAVAARGFRKTSNKVRKAMWWRDMKMRLIIAFVVLVVVGLTTLSIVQAVRNKNRMDEANARAKTLSMMLAAADAVTVTQTQTATILPSSTSSLLSPFPSPTT